MSGVTMVADRNDIINFIAEKKKVSQEEIEKLFYDNKDRQQFDLELKAIVDKSKRSFNLKMQNYYIDKVEGYFIYCIDK